MKLRTQNNFGITLLFLLQCLGSSFVHAWTSAWPEFETPADINSEWIAEDIQHNGMDMKIIRIFGEVPAEDTLEFYERKWSSKDIHARGFSTGTHIVLSRVYKLSRGTFQFTLELEPHGKQTRGVLSLMRLDASRNHPASALDPELPSGVDLISDTLSIDANIINRTLVATHKNSVMHHEFRFKQILESKGWSQEHPLIDEATMHNITQKERLLRFFRNKDELTINLIPKDGTTIVAVYLRKP